MKILGLTAPLSWNQAAAIVVDGKLLAAVEEERYVRIKHAPRMLPLNAIDFCLDFAKLKPEDIDVVTFGYRSPFHFYLLSAFENLKERNLKRALREGGAFAEYLTGLIRLKDWMEKKHFRLHGKNKLKMIFFPHEFSHAASTFHTSGFTEANIITLDGQGENDAGFLGIGRNGQIRRFERIGHHQSLGWVYEKTTDLLGFKSHSHEGKVMGLAASGKRKLSLNGILEVGDDFYRINHDWVEKFWQRFGPRREKNQELTDRHRNIAKTVQDFSEKAGVAMARRLYRKTGLKDFCLAGGVALNCDMNSKIYELPFVENIHIIPAADDSGTAIGGALEAASLFGEKADFKMDHAYWGPAYANEGIEALLKEAKLNFERVSGIEKIVAKEIAKGKIVGWFQGRSELGPRALGNRSILAHPGLSGMKDKINKEVKHRETWRPFAPSILNEAGKDYFENYYPNPFMLLTLKVKKNKQKDLSAAIHIDGTARHQSVDNKTNPRYYKLISEFASLTGIPAVLNTSFNDREQPLVNTPADAVRTFFSTGLDLLAIGDFLVKKPEK